MHDSSMHYPNKLKLCRTSFKNYATRAIYFAEMSPHHVEFVLELINIYIVHFFATFHIVKCENWKKNKKQKTETTFHKCSANRCPVELSKIKGSTCVGVSFKYSWMVPAIHFLRKIPRHRCFAVIYIHTLKFSSAQKFLMTF